MRLILNSKKKAQSLIEYALILAMVAVVAVAALQLLGDNIGTALRTSADAVGAGTNTAGEQACNAMGPGFKWDGKVCTYDSNSDNATGGTTEGTTESTTEGN